MGEHKVNKGGNAKEHAIFNQHLLDDIRALEIMLEKGMIEDDIIRIGAEQEFCLVTDNWRPSVLAERILADVNDPHFTTELAKYNLEINLDPFELSSNCFSQVKDQLIDLLEKAKASAAKFNNKVLLTGILPTISKEELDFDFMTPNPRYWALNDVLKERRGGDFDLYLTGVDELSISHDSVLFEACNTSFQLHLQIKPEDFVSSYNWSQAISGPLLGISSNSPLLMGRELWSETRIALFQQSIDTRNSSYALKDQQARVTFGSRWEKGSIADIYKHDIAQYNTILTKEIEHNSLDLLKEGKVPKLQALSLNNGTIYKWNRPCYGVGGGKAHVRIENRYIPAGPSVLDEIANFAFWVGLMIGRPQKYDNMESAMDFRDAKSNFINAARTGKNSMMIWDGKSYSVSNLIEQELLPIAYKGLKKVGIPTDEISSLLGVIEDRLQGSTGAQWMVNGYRELRENMKKDDALVSLTEQIYQNQSSQKPVSEWSTNGTENIAVNAALTVGHIMSTNLFTVNENDLANMATSIMSWENINHVPVENKSRELVGLLTNRHIQQNKGSGSETIVADIMVRDLVTVERNSSIIDAIELMKEKDIGCLPVLEGEQLVGIVTVTDVRKFQGNGKSI